MKKKIKKLFTSKRGSYALMAIIFIPILLTLVATLVCAKRNETVYRTEIKNSITSYFEYANKYNANIVSKIDDRGNRADYCNYNPSQQQKIKSEFDTYFKKIDGYNRYWTYETILFVQEDGSYSIKFKCYCYIPRVTSLKVVNYWGIYDGTYKTNDDNSWYGKYKNTMDEIITHGVTESGAVDGTENLATPYILSTKYWQKIVVEVDSSCV